MKFANLLYRSYWFNQPIIATKNVYLVWLIGLMFITAVGLGSLILGVVTKSNINKNIFKKFGDLFSTLGIVGLLLFFFRQQSIPFFSLRIWFLAWGVSFAIWLGVILKYVFRRVPQIKAEQQEKARKEKYLPGNS